MLSVYNFCVPCLSHLPIRFPHICFFFSLSLPLLSTLGTLFLLENSKASEIKHPSRLLRILAMQIHLTTALLSCIRTPAGRYTAMSRSASSSNKLMRCVQHVEDTLTAAHLRCARDFLYDLSCTPHRLCNATNMQTSTASVRVSPVQNSYHLGVLKVHGLAHSRIALDWVCNCGWAASFNR